METTNTLIEVIIRKRQRTVKFNLEKNQTKTIYDETLQEIPLWLEDERWVDLSAYDDT